LSLPVLAWDASAIGAKGSSGKGDSTGEGRSKIESGHGKVSIDNGDAGAMSNWQQKRIKLQQQKVMWSAAAVAAATADGSGTIRSGIACSGQKWQQSSLLEEEVAQHAVQVQSHRHSVDFSMLSRGTKLLKLNHGHYKKLRLLVVVSCSSSIGSDLHQRVGTGAVYISESDFNKLVYCVLPGYHSVLSWSRLPDDTGQAGLQRLVCVVQRPVGVLCQPAQLHLRRVRIGVPAHGSVLRRGGELLLVLPEQQQPWGKPPFHHQGYIGDGGAHTRAAVWRHRAK
jgi:hypothetical protein